MTPREHLTKRGIAAEATEATEGYLTLEIARKGQYAGIYAVLLSEIDSDLLDMRWAVMRNCYVVNNQNHKTTFMHRLILERVLGRTLERNELVDHINGNGFDNRRENLRLADYFQNAYNCRRPSTTGLKGVSWDKEKKKYVSRIRFDGKRIQLGRFDTPEEAHEAYKEAALKYHGEFATLEVKKVAA